MIYANAAYSEAVKNKNSNWQKLAAATLKDIEGDIKDKVNIGAMRTVFPMHSQIQVNEIVINTLKHYKYKVTCNYSDRMIEISWGHAKIVIPNAKTQRILVNIEEI